MKKHLLFFTALALASCAKVEPSSDFSLQMELPCAEESKTTLSDRSADGKYQLWWSNGDKISVNGTISNALSGISGNTAVANFSFASQPVTASIYNVLYPGTTETAAVSFPAVQTYREGTPDAAACPMYASVTTLSSTISLQNYAAVLCFSLNGSSTLDRIEIESLGGELLSGQFKAVTNNGYFTGALAKKSGSNSASLNFGSLALSGTDKKIYVAIPAQAYSKGIVARVFDSAGTYMQLKFWGAGFTASGRKVYEFPSKTYIAGRAYEVTSLGSLTGQATYVELGGDLPGLGTGDAPKATQIKFATFNTWSIWARQGNAVGPQAAQLQWEKAYKAVADCIKAVNPDIVNLQEVTEYAFKSNSSSSIRNLLTDYTWVMYLPNVSGQNVATDDNVGSDHLGAGNAILFKTSAFTKESSGIFWLQGYNYTGPGVSTTDSLYTKHRTGNYNHYDVNRHCVYAKFTHKSSGKAFWVFAPHFSLRKFDGPDGYRTITDEAAQSTNARTVLYKAKQLMNSTTVPSVIMGDLNMTDGNYSYGKYMKDNGRWVDAYEAVATRDGEFRKDGYAIATQNMKDNETMNDWRPDHIFVDNFNIVSYGVDRNKYKNASGVAIFPSDHFLVYSVLAFE